MIAFCDLDCSFTTPTAHNTGTSGWDATILPGSAKNTIERQWLAEQSAWVAIAELPQFYTCRNGIQ